MVSVDLPMVTPLRDCRLHLTDGVWPFEAERADDIAAHWRSAIADKPAMWDGRILMMQDWSMEEGVLTGAFADVAYSSFHAWKTWGFPDASIVNCFGSGVLRTADNALIYGVMGRTTSNAGRIYPVGGTLDHDDVREGGAIDMFGSIARELTEETGLTVAECRRGERLAVCDRQLMSVAEVLDFSEDAEPLAARIRATIAAQDDPELDDVMIVRRATDLDSTHTFAFARMIAERLLS